jgi:tetratricopeptide (TPR) repeat protein
MAGSLAARSEPGDQPQGNAYELMLAKLHTDRQRLKDVQSIERKIEVKRELLPDYEAWVTGVLESGRGGQDDVLTSVLVWYIDVGDYERGLDVAQYVIDHGLTLPDQYNRDVPTMLADEIGDAALSALRLENGHFETAVIERALSMLAERDMPDQAKAKLYKAAGLCLRQADPERALANLRRALDLDERSGVKREITSIETELKKAGSLPA